MEAVVPLETRLEQSAVLDDAAHLHALDLLRRLEFDHKRRLPVHIVDVDPDRPIIGLWQLAMHVSERLLAFRLHNRRFRGTRSVRSVRRNRRVDGQMLPIDLILHQISARRVEVGHPYMVVVGLLGEPRYAVIGLGLGEKQEKRDAEAIHRQHLRLRRQHLLDKLKKGTHRTNLIIICEIITRLAESTVVV